MNKSIKKLYPYILLLPVLIFIIGIFIFGIITSLLQSFGYFPAAGLYTFTLKYFREIIKNPNFINSLKFSLHISFVSSFFAVLFGVLLAYFLLKNKKKIYEIYKLPIIVPHTVAALLMFILFTQSGWIPRLLYNLGLINSMMDFDWFLFDPKGIGIIIAYTWKGLPFITLITYDTLKKTDVKYSKVAANLGASPLQIYLKILLPITLPTILLGFLMLFTFSLGAFEIPYLLGPSSPKALPVMAYIFYKSIDLYDRPYAMAINMFITFLALIMAIIYIFMQRLVQKYNKL
ncbi:ABC transporter permease subunit [Caloramator sp. CAR-1]|uniref:ABC transporter permease n=1 Tax=Caloramator sp. CAR-1 TaxID=3062777 RepID=UPI0026E1AF8B|nr:ABC transporter permease subunit [Caloramator sp. CAR-1]MDO6354064.1 ABC transporter permease subunit [Caloramator sp. CAR-1]